MVVHNIYHPRLSRGKQLIPKTQKMQIWKRWSQLPWSYCRKEPCQNGPKETQRSSWLPAADHPHRSPKIPWIYRILLILHTQLLKNCKTTLGPNEEGNGMEMGRSTIQSFQRTQNLDVHKPGSHTTKLQKEVLPPMWCIGLWPGGHTLTRGRKWHTLIT
jgi:hypothetical protein